MKNIVMVLALLLSIGATGQIDVRNIEVRQNGNRSEISFDAQIDKKATGRNYKLTMTPVLYNNSYSVELPPIVVESRRTRIMDARNRVQPLPGAVLTQNGRTVRYVASINYSEWLSSSDLRFDMIETGCCTETALYQSFLPSGPMAESSNELNLRVGGMIMIAVKNARVFPLRYTAELSSAQTILSRLEVGFRVNSSRLDLFEYNNNRVLNEIITVLRDGTLEERIEITGYASPEGVQANNYNLAQNRALAVRNYILDNVPHLRPTNFNIINGGENWEGLYKLVEGSSMPGRWQVLDIIERTPINIDHINNSSRKKMLMDLNGGQTWKYMLTNFFPNLRSAATITIYAPRTGMSEGSGMPPAQNTEIINRAIDLIGERNSSQALSLLSQVENDPRAWNPMGIAYLLEYNIARAKEYFQKSAEAGYSEGKLNLEQVANNY